MAIEMYCPVCCKDTGQASNWLGSRCNECGYISNGDLARVVRNRRELLGISRKEIASEMGIKRETVYKYEKVWPSKKYLDQTKMLIIKAKGVQV
jgi:ribosome-binding protein aMBF1 (putative translation factor)